MLRFISLKCKRFNSYKFDVNHNDRHEKNGKFSQINIFISTILFARYESNLIYLLKKRVCIYIYVSQIHAFKYTRFIL